MTNNQLQEILKTYPDSSLVNIPTINNEHQVWEPLDEGYISYMNYLIFLGGER